jgi:hypothetical protein
MEAVARRGIDVWFVFFGEGECFAFGFGLGEGDVEGVEMIV